MVQEKTTLILDTDPGVDDVLAILLALSDKNVDLKLISLCFGNCDTINSLRNAVSTFYVVKQEEKFRGNSFKYTNQLPKLAVGLTHALDGTQLDATEFHGADGLGNVHDTAPEFTCPSDWLKLFDQNTEPVSAEQSRDLGFIPSTRPSYLDMLDILREEPENTVTICAVGPLMNLAKAAEIDYKTFSRVKEICVMGGALDIPGNVSPLAEFNIFSDCIAADRIFNYTSYQTEEDGMDPLKLILFPLDVTNQHELDEKAFDSSIAEALKKGSPLAKWINVWMTRTFYTAREMITEGRPIRISLHDPLTVWYFMTKDIPGWRIKRDVDLRIETTGQWTRGCVIYDKRHRAKSKVPLPNDRGSWRLEGFGNRVSIAEGSPNDGTKTFGSKMMQRILM